MKKSVQIGFPEASPSTFLAGGVTRTLPRLVRSTKALELIFVGEKVADKEAENISLASRCFADDQFETKVTIFSDKPTQDTPMSMSLAKELLNRASDYDYKTALQYELEGMTFCSATDDWQKGVDVFKEKRKPVYGRDSKTRHGNLTIRCLLKSHFQSEIYPR